VAVIAVVDDDTAFLDLMSELLSEEGYQVITGRSAKQAHHVIRDHSPDLVVLDIRMEHPEAGWNLLELLRLDRRTVSIPVIVASADARFLHAKAQQLHHHHCDILVKPFTIDELLAKIDALIGPSSRAVGG
jgi:DNA-binding response OmpR family regulator